MRGGADAGQLQNLDRADRAGGHDHFAAAACELGLAVLPEAHAVGARAVECHGFDKTLGLEPQVRAIEHRLEEAARRRPAPAALLVDVVGARALVVAGVEIVDPLDAGLLGGHAERIEQIPAHARMLDPPFAADRMMIAFAEEMVLVLLEERQHVVPAPAGEAELAPVVVVAGLAAHVDHGVDRRRAADHLAARIVQRAAVEAGHRFGLEHPVGARIADREQVTDRDVIPDPVVAAAGFEQQHAIARIGAEPVRQHAARRARADDDVIVFAFDRFGFGHSILLRCSVRTSRAAGNRALANASPAGFWTGIRRARISLPPESEGAERRSAHLDAGPFGTRRASGETRTPLGAPPRRFLVPRDRNFQ